MKYTDITIEDFRERIEEKALANEDSFTMLANGDFVEWLDEMCYNMKWLSQTRETELDVLYCIYFLSDKNEEIVDIIVDYLDLELEN